MTALLHTKERWPEPMAVRLIRPASEWLVIPAVAVAVVLFLAPLAHFLMISFWRVRAYRLQPDLTLDQYVAVFVEYGYPLVYTFTIAFVIAAAVTPLAFAFAYFCRFKAGRHGTLLVFLVLITLVGGYLTKIYMWKTILGAQGVLNTALIWLGIVDEPVQAFLFSPVAVILTLIHYTLPFAILPVYGALRGIADTPLEAARDLGGSRTRVFRDIILPQCRLGLLSSFAMSFLFAVGDYVTPVLVGGPRTSMIGLFIQSQFGHRMNAPLGAAMSFTVVALAALVVAVVGALLWRGTRFK